jgi:hypothetical protein
MENLMKLLIYTLPFTAIACSGGQISSNALKETESEANSEVDGGSDPSDTEAGSDEESDAGNE